MWTVEPNFARYAASSIAVSPPPTTARGWLRNAGRAPSQTAHALTPPPVWARRSSLGRPSQFATAPVAMITAWVRTSPPPEVFSTNGWDEKSQDSISSATTRVPNRSACFWNSDIISGPVTPSGNPG